MSRRKVAIPGHYITQQGNDSSLGVCYNAEEKGEDVNDIFPRDTGLSARVGYGRLTSPSGVRGLKLDPDYLDKLLEEYQYKQQETQRPQKIRLIDAYTAGILTLDDIAAKKTGLEKQITELTAAIGLLQAELDPKILSREEIEQIHQFAAKVRKGLNVARGSFNTKRKIAKLLRVEVTLHCINGENWAEVKCVLGERALAVECNTIGRRTAARDRADEARFFRQ